MEGLRAFGATAVRGYSVIEGVLTREALTSAVNDVFLVCAVLFFGMIPVVWMAKPPFGTVAAGSGGH
jgi:DHA2 family multidrug resistance protein